MEQTNTTFYANEMVRLFTAGHLAEQTLAYQTAQKAYLRSEVVRVWKEGGYIPPPDHIVG